MSCPLNDKRASHPDTGNPQERLVIEKHPGMSPALPAPTQAADHPMVHRMRRTVVRSLSAGALGAIGGISGIGGIGAMSAVGTFGAGLLPQPAHAQSAATFPSKPMRWIVPFPPGGPTDSFSRPVAQKLSEILGQPVIVENIPGADLAMRSMPIEAPAPGMFSTTTG